MKPPIHRLRKADIIWLNDNLCQAHSTSYLQHYGCYLKENPPSPFQERIGYFDIEACHLNPQFGYMISYAILDGDTDTILGRVLTPHEVRSGKVDSRLMKELCADLKKFHRIVVHYGGDRCFDIPFVRTRSIKFGLDFPLYKDVVVSDTWRMARQKLRLLSNKLENICKFFDISAKNHPLEPDIWQRAMVGNKDALEYIWTHNKEDVFSLRDVFKLLWPYVPQARTSI